MNQMKQRFLGALAVFVGCSFFLATPSIAQPKRSNPAVNPTVTSTARPFMLGAHAGLITGDYSANILLGAEGSYRVIPALDVGARFSWGPAETGVDVAGVSSSSSLFLIGGMASYVFDELLQTPGFYAGGQLGIGVSSSSATVFGVETSTSNTDLYLGFHGGYRHALTGQLSVGGRVELLANIGTALNLLGTVHYAF